MTITLITVGKLKEKYLIEGIKEYSKRLTSYTKLNIIEVPDEKAPENLSESDQEIIKEKEGNKILSKIPKDSYVISLVIGGKQFTSEQLASKLENLQTYGNSKITFIIGGSLGLSKEIINKSSLQLSFSKFTFPHQLMRLILIEQIYRSFRIMNGEPYHK